MSGRPAPPGRRGSVKKEAFKADEDTAAPVAPVELTAAEKQKQERDEEMKRAMALRKKAQEDEQLAAQREQEERKQEAARKREVELKQSQAESKAAADAARQEQLREAAERQARVAAEEEARQKQAREAAASRQAEEERIRDAERAASEKRQREQRAEEEAAQARAAAEAEAARTREDEARAERDRMQREQEQQAAAQREAEAEKSRVAKAEAAKAAKAEAARLEQEMAEKLRLQQEKEDREFEEEQAQQRRELEAKRKAREAEEIKRQAEQQAFLEQQKEIEEQQRRMDEKLALQKAQRAEAAANEQRELERQQALQRAQAEERERQRAEVLAAKAAAEEAEIARLRAEEAQRQQELLEAQQREEAAHNEEVKRLEAERAAAAEEARKAEAAISEFENAALEEKKRRAEAQRKKREMFLNDLDSFSTNFEAKNAAQDEQIKEEQDKHYELLAQQMKEVEAVKASVAAKEAAEKEQRAAAVAAAQAAAAAEALAAAKAAEAASIPTPAPAVVAAPAEDGQSIRLGADAGAKDRLGDLLTSTLFTSSSSASAEATEQAAPSTSGPVAMVLPEEETGGESTEAAGSDELRVPTRIGSGKAKVKPAPYKPAPASVISAKAEAAIAKYSEDEEEEGTGEIGSISNVLTLEERRKMTLAQKETWRAKQADLTEKRKDFHGVVTYTFDGVFSWQMYGSAEAVDESGSNYTEYLMRCQWGTTFENMQPWIVAHRYREFDQLDQAMKRKFPRLEANMPKLPKKELFRALSSDVVAERRSVLEDYMSKIVVSMPSLLRSELMNDFLDITNRISGIRLKLLKESNKRVAEAAAGGASVDTVASPAAPVKNPAPMMATPPPAPAPGVKSSAVPSNSKYGIEDPLSYNKFSAMTAGPELFSADIEDEPLFWTLDEAEEARAARHSVSLDEDALGHLETDIRTMGQLLRKGDHKDLLDRNSRFRSKFRAVSKRWPNLRATAVVGMGVDFTLIPRAMQAEEDLLRYINEFRNIETAASMSSRMTAV